MLELKPVEQLMGAVFRLPLGNHQVYAMSSLQSCDKLCRIVHCQSLLTNGGLITSSETTPWWRKSSQSKQLGWGSRDSNPALTPLRAGVRETSSSTLELSPSRTFLPLVEKRERSTGEPRVIPWLPDCSCLSALV